jgi:hypothetical protein
LSGDFDLDSLFLFVLLGEIKDEGATGGGDVSRLVGFPERAVILNWIQNAPHYLPGG